jgi:taurine dioxygenase
MAYKTINEMITVTPVSPYVGAEISDIDLTQPLPDSQLAQLRDAFARHGVLFFRDQEISFDDHLRLASYIGPLERHVGIWNATNTTENPLVRKMHYDETSELISGERFHSDQTCNAIPPLATVLYLHTVPPHGGGDTIFGSMYAAYDALSPHMKSYLGKLTATHDGTRTFGPGKPVSVHPVIIRHPVTGKNVIFVNPIHTSHINDVPRLESDRILQYVYDHCANETWQYRFRWQPHSIAFWDNRCLSHKAVWDYWPAVRSGYRVQLEATEAPVPGDASPEVIGKKSWLATYK